MARLTDNNGTLLGGLQTLPLPMRSPLTPTQRSTSAAVKAPAAPPHRSLCVAPTAAQDRRSAQRAK